MANGKRHRELFGCDDALNKIVAERLVERRKELDLTQGDMAKRMGVGQNTVSRIEGAVDNISLTKLVRYVEALGSEIEIKLPSQEGEIYLIRHRFGIKKKNYRHHSFRR